MPKSTKSVASSSGNIWGARAFLIGVILAVVIGFAGIDTTEGWWALVLVIIGIIVGLLNVGGSEMKEFLLAGAVLVIISDIAGNTLFGISYIGNVFKALIALFVPATIVVALKTVYAVAKH